MVTESDQIEAYEAAFRAARRIASGDSLLEDLAMSDFFRVWEKVSRKYDPARGIPVSAYFLWVFKQNAYGLVKRERLRRSVCVSIDAETDEGTPIGEMLGTDKGNPSARLASVDAVKEIKEALAGLTDTQRCAVLSRLHPGKARGFALRHGISRQAVDSARRNGIKKIKEVLRGK